MIKKIKLNLDIESEKYPYLIVRLMPAVYSRYEIKSKNKTLENCLKEAKKVAKKLNKRVCLAWDKDNFYFIEKDGIHHSDASGRPRMFIVPNGKDYHA